MPPRWLRSSPAAAAAASPRGAPGRSAATARLGSLALDSWGLDRIPFQGSFKGAYRYIYIYIYISTYICIYTYGLYWARFFGLGSILSNVPHEPEGTDTSLSRNQRLKTISAISVEWLLALKSSTIRFLDPLCSCG